MAYMNTTRTASNGWSDRFAAVIATAKLAMQRRRVFNQTVRELDSLSSRELADLGLHRSMITRIAREAAYGK